MVAGTQPTAARGPRGVPLLGSLPELSRDPFAFFTRVARDHGDVATYKIAHRRLWLVSHPTGIEEVLLQHRARTHKDSMTRGLSRVLGYGLLTTEDDVWKRRRSLAAPSFTPRHIASYADVMVDVAERRMGALLPGEVELHHEMTEITMEIVLRTLFGGFTPKTERAGRVVTTFMELFEREMRSVWRVVPQWASPIAYRMARCRAELVEILGELVQERRASGIDGDDLLGRLLAARDDDGQGLTDEQLLDECITLFAAGHETTAIALTFAAWLVACHPHVQQALADECAEVLGDRAPTLKDLSALPWHQAVVKEAMRLYPPAWVIGRTPITPDVTVMGQPIPMGDPILLPAWVVHRDPRWWVDPDAFRPERWLEGSTDRPRFAYFPYGGGPRVCVGSHFATMEAVLVLAVWFRRFRVTATSRETPELMPAVTLRPRGGLTVHIEGRTR